MFRRVVQSQSRVGGKRWASAIASQGNTSGGSSSGSTGGGINGVCDSYVIILLIKTTKKNRKKNTKTTTAGISCMYRWDLWIVYVISELRWRQSSREGSSKASCCS